MAQLPLASTAEQTLALSAHAQATAVQPPTEGLLNQLNVAGRAAQRSAMDAQAWICPICGARYEAIQNLLIDLPWPRCINPDPAICNQPWNHAFFDFRITSMSLHGVPLSLPVYNQGKLEACVVFACATVAQIAKKVQWALLPHAMVYTQSVDMACLVENYFNSIYHGGQRAGTQIPLVLYYLCKEGAPWKVDPQRNPSPIDPARNLKIRSYYNVDPKDVLSIIRMLASGIPLVGMIVSGRRMDYATVGEVYLPPPPGATNDRHAVALIGAGYRARPAGSAICYAARDSHSLAAHANGQQGFDQHHGARGGDFQVYAEHVLEIWGVYV